jgi:ABC-type polysaccharide/polyol phosphate transport system ATPase subunit
MKLRLGISVALHSDPDIIILDENISVGDYFFKEKSLKRVKELLKSGKTMVIASHDMGYIRGLCERVVWLENHKKFYEGTTLRVIKSYEGKSKAKWWK